jgi:hypothetical protein
VETVNGGRLLHSRSGAPQSLVLMVAVLASVMAAGSCGSGSALESGPKAAPSSTPTGSCGSCRTLSPTGLARNPRILAVVQGQRLQIRSAVTGKLIGKLGERAGTISLTPNAKYVYYEGTATLDPFPINRIAVAGGKPVRVASGEDPAVSPNGKQLAYATGDGDAVAIENLARHSTRRINLKALIGPGASFNNTPGIVTWLSDDRLVAFPPADATLTARSASAATSSASTRTCSALYKHRRQCVIVIDLAAAQPAHLDVLPASRPMMNLVSAGAGPSPNSLLIGSLGTIERFHFGPSGVKAAGTLSVPGQESLVEGFSPSGHEVLYLRNHGPVQLWVGTIGARITPTRELLANADLGTISW